MRIVSFRSVSTPAAVLGIALACGALQPPAFAYDGEPTKVVRFADLDITRPTDVAELYRRIRSAARDVCRIPLLDRHWSAGAEQACVDRAVDRGVKSVGSPQLARLHGARSLHVAGR